MAINHVNGNNKGALMLYTLSTCVWCKKTKALLADLGVAYDYVDVDLLVGSERDQVENEIRRWNPHGSFPTLVIGDRSCIIGYDESKIRQAVGG